MSEHCPKDCSLSEAGGCTSDRGNGAADGDADGAADPNGLGGPGPPRADLLENAPSPLFSPLGVLLGRKLGRHTGHALGAKWKVQEALQAETHGMSACPAAGAECWLESR